MKNVFSSYTLRSILALILFLFPSPALVQNAGQFRSEGSPNFFCELVNLVPKNFSQSRLTVMVSILYDELQFVRTEEGFRAQYEISISVADKHGEWVTGKEFKQTIKTLDYEETNSRSRYRFHSTTFDLEPEKYAVTITVTDLEADLLNTVTINKKLRNFAEQNLSTSDMVFLHEVGADSATGLSINAGLYQNRIGPDKQFYAYLEMYRNADFQPVNVDYTIYDQRDNKMLAGKITKPEHGNRQRLILPIIAADLPYGKYKLELQMQNGQSRVKATGEFRVSWNGIPATTTHLVQAITAVDYLATDKERAALRSGTVVELQAAVGAFWKSRDPTPRTEANEAMDEYYQRVEYANEKFSERADGWKTDRGRVYILFGPPDRIEREPAIAGGNRYEVWNYHHLNQRFLFVDRLGFGDYLLADVGQL
jgi:GWxTD domain-containing protein